MSQTAPSAAAPQPQPVPQQAPRPGQPAAPGKAAHASVQPGTADFSENVPLLLNRLQVGAVSVVVIAGVLAAVLQVLAWQASGRAAANTEQVVRIQQVQSLLLRADAVATNGYLVGGLEPAEQRAAYDAALEEVLRLVTDAAEAQPADRAVLADLNATINEYATAVAQARDYNRQQLEIGIAYLSRAGDTLREEALPITEALVAANAERAQDEMDAPSPLLLLLVGAVALAALWWVNRQIARRFRRRFNTGLVAAAAIIALLTIASASNAWVRQSANDENRDGAYRVALDEAAARTAANNAKSFESQGLINRGSGAAFEGLWEEQADTVTDLGSDAVVDLWEQYVGRHQEIREADDAGEWEIARDLAISTDPGSATAILDELDAAAARTADEQGQEAEDGFGEGSVLTLALAILSLVGAFAAAGAIAWGVGQRRREYS